MLSGVCLRSTLSFRVAPDETGASVDLPSGQRPGCRIRHRAGGDDLFDGADGSMVGRQPSVATPGSARPRPGGPADGVRFWGSLGCACTTKVAVGRFTGKKDRTGSGCDHSGDGGVGVSAPGVGRADLAYGVGGLSSGHIGPVVGGFGGACGWKGEGGGNF